MLQSWEADLAKAIPQSGGCDVRLTKEDFVVSVSVVLYFITAHWLIAVNL